METLSGSPLRFSWAHGDFATWNTYLHKDKLYLFDWENFELHAPFLLDLVYCVLSHEAYVRANRNAAEIVSKISDIMKLNSISWTRHDLILALIYLKVHNDSSTLSLLLDNMLAALER